jgi:hypothetical protein
MKFGTWAAVAVVAAAVAAPACAQQAAWRTYTSPALGFSAEFPGEVVEARNVTTRGGMERVEFTFSTQLGKNAFAVREVDFGRSAPDPVGTLRETVTAVAAAAEASVESSEATTVGGEPARDAVLKVTTADGVVRVRWRIVFKGTRMYQAMATTLEGTPDTDAARFVRSFTVSEPSGEAVKD